MKYTHGAKSPSDSSNVPLKYSSQEEAQHHADLMNSLINTWDENPIGFWNKDHWRVKPEPWIVVEL